MSLESIIQTYGYWALMIGTFFEGETILVIGGFAAHRGYLSLPLVILAAFIGTLAGDQLYFFIGRKKGNAFLDKRPSWKPHMEKVRILLERYQALLILGFRFLYGLRTVTPFVLGMSRVKTANFIMLNVVGALVWAALFGTGGYLFGAALEIFLEDIKRYERLTFLGMFLAGLAVWVLHLYQKYRGRLRNIQKSG
ncbi:MAG TPA: DedA family protein [Nitrospiraceae bacterium]|nr:DedA family protein [Nitrospiraceae bacterium]